MPIYCLLQTMPRGPEEISRLAAAYELCRASVWLTTRCQPYARFDHAGAYGDDLPEGERAASANCYASASVRKSVAVAPISLGLTGSSPAVAAGLVADAATFRESAPSAIIIFQRQHKHIGPEHESLHRPKRWVHVLLLFSLQCTAGQAVPRPEDYLRLWI
jgi:hypothetical protein